MIKIKKKEREKSDTFAFILCSNGHLIDLFYGFVKSNTTSAAIYLLFHLYIKGVLDVVKRI